MDRPLENDKIPSAKDIMAEVDKLKDAAEGEQRAEVSPEVEAEAVEPSKEEAVVKEASDSSVKELASQFGWSADGEKSADEFVKYALENLAPRGRELTELKSTINEMKSHMDKQKQLGYRQAMDDLLDEKRLAIELGDVSGVDDIDAKIETHKKEMGADNPVDPQVQSFMTKHADWMKDPSYEAAQIREFVGERDKELVQYGLSADAHLAQIEKDLATKFPHRFGEKKEAPAAVESGSGRSRPATKKAKFIFADLSPEQKTCARHFERKGIMKTEEYIKQLVELGELN